MLKPPQLDYLTLDAAAEYMTAGTHQEWTSKDIIQAAANYEIAIWFSLPIALRLVRTEPLEGEENEISAPVGSFPRISKAACQSLIAAGVAYFDGWDNPKNVDFFGPCKTFMRDWKPAEGEVMPEIRPNDCSVSAAGINQLLTKYSEPDETTTQELNPKNSEQTESKKRREDVKEPANQLAPGSAKKSSCDAFEPGSWQEQACIIGKEWMLKEEEGTGQRPSQVKIAKFVEGEFTNRNIKGVRGKFLDFETIRREALKGITGRPQNGKK